MSLNETAAPALLDAEGCRLNWSHLFERNTGRDSMMRIPGLALSFITLMWLAVLLPTNPAIAQERLVFRVSADNTQYTQQHTIDVGDVAGHQVRLFEIKRVYPTNAPLIGGMKIVESWTRGMSDYTNNSGEARTYGIYILENGDKFFTRGSLVAIQGPEARNLTATTAGPITGGTGKLARINGMARAITLANPQTGMNETQIEIDYWLPQ
jgi:hypothetical protein